MHLPRRTPIGRSRTRSINGTSLIRVRIWMAMLGMAVIPMLGAILLTNSLAPKADDSVATARSWETSVVAADLAAYEQLLEARLLSIVADSEVHGIAGNSTTPDQETAARVVATLEDGHTGLVRGVCLTRGVDGARVYLSGEAPRTVSTMCGAAAMVAKAMTAGSDRVVRATARGPDGARHLILSTTLVGASRRNAGVLTVEIGLRELFAATPSASTIASAALMVDMTNSEIVAASRSDATAPSAGSTGALGYLGVRVNGILTGHPGTARSFQASGWAATAAPLWRAGEDTHLGLILVWPAQPAAPATMLTWALIGFALFVVVVATVVARTFLKPFADLAQSRSQLEVLYREAREDSLHDGLTGLGNHRSFQEELDRQLELFQRHQVPVALLLLDLDDLKVVNDNEGHPAGDRLLVGMGNAIRDALRYGDRAFRIGGDEFAVILPYTDAAAALIAANRLRHFCLRPPAGERVIPFSGGISSVPNLAADRSALFRQADAALYRCKRHGRGSVEIFDHDRDRVADDPSGHGAIEAVRDIVRSRNLTPVYQPIVDLRDGNVLGFEGLIRPGPGTPFTNPSQLFAAAAGSGRTVELDLACFEVVAAGSAQINDDQVITINLSPRTLELQDYSSSWLLEILARYQISPGRVIVELTEREAITDLERLRINVAALQHSGIRIAADDVGAGNAGLRLLSQVRFDIVKIDLSLVQDGTEHDSARAVLRSLMELAQRQGAVAIAEGLETAEQLRSLRELGVTTGQGYLLGRPGQNLGLKSVDIEALAAGTLIVENAPGRSRASIQTRVEGFQSSPA